MTATALYRHFDADDQLLYVGISGNPKRRLAEHKSRSVWGGQIDRVDVKWLTDRDTALGEERLAIALGKPLFNGGFGEPDKTGDAFRDWCNSERITQSEIAEAYGYTQSALSKMISGKARASLHFAAFIEDRSEGSVPMRYWLKGATIQKPDSVDAKENQTGGAQ